MKGKRHAKCFLFCVYVLGLGIRVEGGGLRVLVDLGLRAAFVEVQPEKRNKARETALFLFVDVWVLGLRVSGIGLWVRLQG